MKVKAVVLDLDGTITNFNLDFMGARRQALEELDRMNLRTPDMNDQVSLYVLLQRLRERLDGDTFAKVRERFYSLLEKMELKAARQVTLYPGVLETLRKLRGRPLRIGLVTNNGRSGTGLTLRRYDLNSFFDAIVTRDDCEEMKPAPTPILLVLEKLQAKPEEAIFVGDGIMDIMAAKAAGVSSVAVATGPFTSERLIQAQPDYLLSSINDLPSLIETLDDEEIP